VEWRASKKRVSSGASMYAPATVLHGTFSNLDFCDIQHVSKVLKEMLRRGVRYFRSLHSSSNGVYSFVTCQSVVQHAQIKKCDSEALLTQGKFQCDKVVCDKVACGRVVVSDRVSGVRGGGTCMIRWNCCQFFA
jgi:hypothetical protein